MMKVLVACEESQRVCIAFRNRGFEAYSCDLEECSGGHPEWHIQGDAIAIINGNCEFTTGDGKRHEIAGSWDLLIAHPPCTYLTNGGAVRMFRNEKKEYPPYGVFQMVNVDRLKLGLMARDFFFKLMNAGCKRIAIENPIPMKIYMLPGASQTIQPYMFGEPYSKKTCLWLKGLPPLMPTNILHEYHPFINGGGADLIDRITEGRNLQRETQNAQKHFKALRMQWQNNGGIISASK